MSGMLKALSLAVLGVIFLLSGVESVPQRGRLRPSRFGPSRVGFQAASPNRIPAAPAQQFNRPQEVTRCPEDYGLQTYPHPQYCDQFYRCANGTLTIERCENGLLYDGKGAVHEHCNYYWDVNCGDRIAEVLPVRESGCIYDFGLFPTGPNCDTYFVKCVYGEPETTPCEKGLSYDDRIHACNWPDLVPHCVPEDIVGFTCPATLAPGDPALKFWPFPRFLNDCESLFTCVNDKPRLITCEYGKYVNEYTLSCDKPENVPGCYRA